MLLSRKKMATAIIFAIIAAPAAASFTAKNQALLYDGDLDQVAGEFAAYYDWMWKDGFQAMLKTEFDTCEQYNDHSAVTPWREQWVGMEGTESIYAKVPNQDYLESVCPIKAAGPPGGDKEVFRIRSTHYPTMCLEKIFHYEGFRVKDCHTTATTPESNGQWFYFKKGDSGKSFLVTYQNDAVCSIKTQSDGCDNDFKANILWDADANLPFGYVAENWFNEYAMEVATESSVDPVTPLPGTFLKFNQDHASDTSRASKTPYLTLSPMMWGDIEYLAVQTCAEKGDAGAGWHFEAAADNSAVELPGGFATGTCYRGDGTVRTLSASTRTVTDRKLSEIKAGDKVLTLDKDMRKVFTSVKELRHSKSVTDFVEITMRGAEDGQQSVAVTEHHTFPSCGVAGHRLGSKHGHKEKPALAIKAGDCLFTEQGESVVESVKLQPRKPQDVTYTVQLEGQAIDLLVLNGIVTHAKPSSSSAAGHQATNEATTKPAREVLSASKRFHESSQAAAKHFLRAHHTLPAAATLAKEEERASFRSPAMARSSRHRHLSAEDECDDECKNMDPTCAKYATFCQWSDETGVRSITVCDTPHQLLIDRGIRSCQYGPSMQHNVFKYEEKLCSCQAASWIPSATCTETTTTSDEGEHCHELGESCEVNWGSCNEEEHNPPASTLYGGFLSGNSFAFELGNADSSDTRVLRDTALGGAVVGPGGSFTLPEDVTSGVLLGAEVYGGEFILDGTSGVTEVVFVQVVTDASSTITFKAGAVVVMGGSNAGTLLGLNSQDSVRLTALSNTGIVRMEHSVAILITDTVNEPRGKVILIGCQASVHGVVNKGTVNLSGGEYSYKDGTNEGTINVDGDGVQAVYKANNAGTINVAKGVIYATLGTNTGTINISDGVTGEFIVETKNAAGNWGTIMYKGVVVTADINDGKVYIARHA